MSGIMPGNWNHAMHYAAQDTMSDTTSYSIGLLQIHVQCVILHACDAYKVPITL